MVNMPQLSFSKWALWEKRSKFQDGKNPGVYMISITKKTLEGTMPRYDDVAYIGMTNSSKGLFHRWEQFNNSITKGNTIKGNGNSGGVNTVKDLGEYNVDSRWKGTHLYVCGYAIACNTKKKERTPEDLLKMGLIRFLEYKALSECKAVTGHEPRYNTQ